MLIHSMEWSLRVYKLYSLQEPLPLNACVTLVWANMPFGGLREAVGH